MGESQFLTDADFERFRTLIYDASGISFSTSNRSVLESRLKERLRASKLDRVQSYYNLITGDQEEFKLFLDSVTTNLTRFFRNTAHFQTFEHYVIPSLLEKRKVTPGAPVRIWSAGCSTGEEPYSIAIALKEHLPASTGFEVLASDLSLKSLMTGKQGFYPDSRITGVPEAFLGKYFDRVSGGYQITDSIRNLVTFDYHNLKNDSGLRNLDVVFCRNVLIYFDEAAQKAAVQRLWESMQVGGFLFIGHSESLFGMNSGFEFTKTDWACIYTKVNR